MRDKSILPHNIEAEQSLLGGIIISKHLPPDIEIRPEWFYRAAHRTIFSTMLEMDSKGLEIDSVTLSDALETKSQLAEIGGGSYIASLLERTPSLSNKALRAYSRIVREKAIRRSTISVTQDAMHKATNEDQPIEETISQIFSDLANIEYSVGKNQFKDMRSLAKEGITRIEARAKHPDFVSGVPTPFNKLNQLTNGLQSSDLIIVAGRPSMGKSAIAQQIGEHAAEHAGPVAIFSLEMDADSLLDRAFASGAKIPSQCIRSGHLQETDWPRLTRVAGKLANLSILTNDSPSLTAQEIRFLARQAKARMGGLALVVIDYLQLLRPDRREKQRYREVGEITRTLKQMARELKVPVLLLSQLNRSCEARENKRPLLSDLRESGDIEQDADVVMFIYRDEYYCHLCSKGKKSGCTKGHGGLAEVIVAKQRKGPTGSVSLVWREQYTRFEDRGYE